MNFKRISIFFITMVFLSSCQAKVDSEDTNKQTTQSLGAGYDSFVKALSKDNFSKAKSSLEAYESTLHELGASEAHSDFVHDLLKAEDLSALRKGVNALTHHFSTTESGQDEKFKAYACPMVPKDISSRSTPGTGFWLSSSEQVENPYHGEVMYRCGSKVENVEQ